MREHQVRRGRAGAPGSRQKSSPTRRACAWPHGDVDGTAAPVHLHASSGLSAPPIPQPQRRPYTSGHVWAIWAVPA